MKRPRAQPPPSQTSNGVNPVDTYFTSRVESLPILTVLVPNSLLIILASSCALLMPQALLVRPSLFHTSRSTWLSFGATHLYRSHLHTAGTSYSYNRSRGCHCCRHTVCTLDRWNGSSILLAS